MLKAVFLPINSTFARLISLKIPKTMTCLSHKMKYKEVACSKQLKHWLELQFVDENNTPVSGLGAPGIRIFLSLQDMLPTALQRMRENEEGRSALSRLRRSWRKR
jgi:hypothetical protein